MDRVGPWVEQRGSESRWWNKSSGGRVLVCEGAKRASVAGLGVLS